MTRATPPINIVNLGELASVVADLGVPVHGADALGLGLHSNGHLGADILWVPATKQFPVHTHPGDHLLYCVSGTGTITVDEVTYDVRPGDLYMVDGLVPHAVGAGPSDHVLLAIGAPHKPVDSPERMVFTDWVGHVVDTPIFVESE
jgi:quercetin dioxygenase-like cupin family protein